MLCTCAYRARSFSSFLSDFSDLFSRLLASPRVSSSPPVSCIFCSAVRNKIPLQALTAAAERGCPAAARRSMQSVGGRLASGKGAWFKRWDAFGC